jgi:hypothetical protein
LRSRISNHCHKNNTSAYFNFIANFKCLVIFLIFNFAFIFLFISFQNPTCIVGAYENIKFFTFNTREGPEKYINNKIQLRAPSLTSNVAHIINSKSARVDGSQQVGKEKWVCTHFQQRQNFLAKLVVKVGIFGASHVVDEDQAAALSLGTLKGDVQLINDPLQHQND